jgi:hypothetical protein
MLDSAFRLIGDGGIFGVVPHGNTFYFSGKITSQLRLIPAYGFGFVSTHRSDLAVSLPSKTDYERSLRYFTVYGTTYRLDWVGCVTKNYTSPGGLQAEMDEQKRKLAEEVSCAELVRQYPGLVFRKKKVSSRYAEIRFATLAGR